MSRDLGTKTQAMQNPPTLTDRTALIRNRRRARQMTDAALFLHQEAASEIKERLTLVNRTFTSIAIVTGWPEFWGAEFPDAHVIQDTDTLDLEPATHDLVIHAMALHWANDPVGQMIQARRSLKPDGLFLGAMFGGQTLHELRAVLAESEIALAGGISPRVAPMAEIRELGGLLQRAGFALPVADSQSTDVTYKDAHDLMKDLRAMGEGNAINARQKTFTRRSIFDNAAERYSKAFTRPDNRVGATFEIIYLSGWAPDDSQQKPLRPGSATARLADVLGVSEPHLPAGD